MYSPKGWLYMNRFFSGKRLIFFAAAVLLAALLCACAQAELYNTSFAIDSLKNGDHLVNGTSFTSKTNYLIYYYKDPSAKESALHMNGASGVIGNPDLTYAGWSECAKVKVWQVFGGREFMDGYVYYVKPAEILSGTGLKVSDVEENTLVGFGTVLSGVPGHTIWYRNDAGAEAATSFNGYDAVVGKPASKYSGWESPAFDLEDAWYCYRVEHIGSFIRHYVKPVHVSLHKHELSYSANGDTLTAKCVGSYHCLDHLDTQPVSVTVSASDAVYDGQSHPAVLSNADEFMEKTGISKLNVTYTAPNGSAPVYGGNYTASLTADGATACANFSIVPLSVTVSGITAKDKMEDGTTKADLDFSGAGITGLLDGDKVKIASAKGTFADAEPGSNKTVTITDIVFEAPYRNSYRVSTDEPLTTTASILKADDPAVPQTGDSSMPALWLGMSFLSALAFLMLRRTAYKR